MSSVGCVCLNSPFIVVRHLQEAGRKDGWNPRRRVTMESLSGRLASFTEMQKRTKVSNEMAAVRGKPFVFLASLPLTTSISLSLLSLYVHPTPSLLPTGIQTSQNAKFYALSAGFDKFSNEDKTVVIQFSVKHEQKIDCGGGYVKVSEQSVLHKELDVACTVSNH